MSPPIATAAWLSCRRGPSTAGAACSVACSCLSPCSDCSSAVHHGCPLGLRKCWLIWPFQRQAFTHLCARFTLGRSDKGGKASKSSMFTIHTNKSSFLRQAGNFYSVYAHRLPFILSTQHTAQYQRRGLVCTPPSGGFFSSHRWHSLNGCPLTLLPFRLTWCFAKLISIFRVCRPRCAGQTNILFQSPGE